MNRRLFNILSAVSLLACVGVAFLWVRSWLPEDVRWGVVDGTAVVVFSRGEYTVTAHRIYFSTATQTEGPGGGYYPAGIGLRGFLDQLRQTGEAFPEMADPRAASPAPPTPKFRFLGIIWIASAGRAPTNDSRFQYWVAAVPLGWLLVPLAIPPAIWAARTARSRRRSRRNLCRGCGYDLRATSDRCPECGVAVLAGQTGESVAVPSPVREPGRAVG